MSHIEEFFSTKQKRLLEIATWSNILSWVALIAFILGAGAQLLQYQNLTNSVYQTQVGLGDFLKNNPAQAFRLFINMADTALRGIVYYLVLKGISLGLRMIVETDINYRERRNAK